MLNYILYNCEYDKVTHEFTQLLVYITKNIIFVFTASHTMTCANCKFQYESWWMQLIIKLNVLQLWQSHSNLTIDRLTGVHDISVAFLPLLFSFIPFPSHSLLREQKRREGRREEEKNRVAISLTSILIYKFTHWVFSHWLAYWEYFYQIHILRSWQVRYTESLRDQ